MTIFKKYSAPELTAYTSQIVAGYVSNHQMDIDELPSFMRFVYQSLLSIAFGTPQGLTLPGEPAVRIEDSVTPDAIICLEDGKRVSMLKRYLRVQYNLTPDQYRARWNLPPDYPMVAPNYSKLRKEIAKKAGLGQTHHRRGKRKAA